MIFTSLPFIIFFVVVLLGTLIIQSLFQHQFQPYFQSQSWTTWSKNSVKGVYIKHFFLLVASYFFYGWWDWRFCFLLLFVTLVSYLTALYSHRKVIYVVGIAVPLIALGVFKYFNFFLDTLSTISGHEIKTLKIILPVGISFYTFQALSYVIDVHRGKLAVERDFIKLALYISFFPQLVAGPIVRASDFLPQLNDNSRKLTAQNFAIGIQIIAMGFFKKIVLADHLSVFVDDVFRVPIAFHWATIILAVVSYSLQIYFDFSGYSDIATGCAKCLGYDFVMNFNLPYISRSVTEFWRRWHISLSGWLRDYLYIPLGGNRRGKVRQLINLMITMLLGGLWHGANWTFVFWGGLNGVALCLEKIFTAQKKSVQKSVQKSAQKSAQQRHGEYGTRILQNIAKNFLTCAFIAFTWIFFRAENFSEALVIIKGIFTLQNGIKQPFFWSFVALGLLFIAEIIAVIKAKQKMKKYEEGYEEYEKYAEARGFCPIMNLNTITGLTMFFVFVGLILGLAFTGENPFVYFQF